MWRGAERGGERKDCCVEQRIRESLDVVHTDQYLWAQSRDGGQDGGGYREAWKVSNMKMISKVPGVVVLNK